MIYNINNIIYIIDYAILVMLKTNEFNKNQLKIKVNENC